MVGSLSSSYLCVVHFIYFSSSFAVSLFPARATLAPLDLPQNDPSVKSDPFRLSRTSLLHAKVLMMGAKCPTAALQLTNGSKKRSPNLLTVTLDSVDTDKEGCNSRGVQTRLSN